MDHDQPIGHREYHKHLDIDDYSHVDYLTVEYYFDSDSNLSSERRHAPTPQNQLQSINAEEG